VIVFFAEEIPTRSGWDPGVYRVVAATWSMLGALGVLVLLERRDTRGLVLVADGLVLPTDRGRYFVPWRNVEWVALSEEELGDSLVVGLADPAQQRPLGRARRPDDGQPPPAHVVELATLVAPPRLVLATVRHFWRRPEERERLGREDPAATLARVRSA
jgi:hypothetical protein